MAKNKKKINDEIVGDIIVESSNLVGCTLSKDMAKLMIDAVLVRDLPLVQACAMIFCASYIVLIFIADMASILSNRRLRHPK